MGDGGRHPWQTELVPKLACYWRRPIRPASCHSFTVSLLEFLPPYHGFSKHSLPSPVESQVSALYVPRWAEIFLDSLKDRESYNDAKKKLQAAD